MKLEELFEFSAVPAAGADASRPTPTTFRSAMPPLPHELCQDRDWCEQKEKRKKKDKKVASIEKRYSKRKGNR